MKRLFPIIIFFSLVLLPVLPSAAEAQTDSFGFGQKLNDVAQQSGYNPGNEPSLDQRISSYIGLFLSFLGVIFMIIMLYGGYNWMTAGGSEDKIDKAKDTIWAAVIGIIIVIAAYAISVFVVSRIWGSTTTPVSLLVTPVYAQGAPTGSSTPAMLDRLKGVGTGAGYTDATETSLFDIVGTVISALLALLGVIFVLLIVIAGYNWMTAQGDEHKIDKAKDTIRAAIIGLIIVAGAFAIWQFISSYLITGTAGGQQYGGS